MRVTDIKQKQRETLEVERFLSCVMQCYNRLGEGTFEEAKKNNYSNQNSIISSLSVSVFSPKLGKRPVSKRKWHSVSFEALGGSEVSQIFQCRNCDWILHIGLRVESEDV